VISFLGVRKDAKHKRVENGHHSGVSGTERLFFPSSDCGERRDAPQREHHRGVGRDPTAVDSLKSDLVRRPSPRLEIDQVPLCRTAWAM